MRSIFIFVDPRALTRWRRVLPYALLASVSLGIYLQTLPYDFVWDDAQYIIDNFRIQSLGWEKLRAIWTTSYLSNYAPLYLTLLALIHAVSGLDPFGYHLVQLLLHVACVSLVYCVIRKIESPRVALLASLWFAAYAPNVETVAWVSETKSTLAFLFFLLSFLFFIRHRDEGHTRDGVWCAIFLVASLLSKISTIVAPAVFLAYEMREGRLPAKSRWPVLLTCGLICVVFAAVHLASSVPMRQAAVERLRDAAILVGPEPAMQGAYFGGIWTHVLNAPALLLHYVFMALAPHTLTPWRMMQIDTTFNLYTALTWVFALGSLVALVLARGNTRFWGSWFLLFLAPVLQFVPNATWVADRYLYIPVVGALVLVSKLYFVLVDRMPPSVWRLTCEMAVVASIGFLALQSLDYARLWRDDVTLWRGALQHCGASAFCNYKLGDAEMDAGTGDPIGSLERAVAIRPEITYQLALARAYTDVANDYARANTVYQQAQRAGRPLPLSAVTGIARNYYLWRDYGRAERAVEAGLGVNPNFSSLLIVRAFIRWKQQDVPGARAALLRALELNCSNPESLHPPRFLLTFWKRPAEVGALLRDLGPL